jgi:dienelactone hydrolase
LRTSPLSSGSELVALEPVGYRVGENEFTGWLADGSKGGAAPGILVVHESIGLTAHIRERTERLAEQLDAVAFAADLFGETGLTLERAREHSRALAADVPALRVRMRAALAVLERHPRVDAARLAAIGYCFGGAAAVELARDGAPLAAIVGFHAGILAGTAADDAAIRGRILLCHGADDPAVPPARIRAFAEGLSTAGIDWQLHLYGGVGHSFTNPEIDAWGFPGFAYDQRADRRSWAAMRGLFDETLS